MPPADDILLLIGKPVTVRNANLLFDQIDPAYFLGNGVLDLYPCIHFHEVIISTGIQQKFDGSHTVIADALGGSHGILKQALTDILLQNMARCLLQQLLVATLRGAVPLIQMHDIPVLVCHQLHLDMLRLHNEFLHINGIIPEICTGLRFGRIKGICQLLCTIRTTHTASAAAIAGLDQYRIADALCHDCGILYGFQ